MADSTPSGIIIMDKHEGVSSFRIIQILRKMFDTKKVGHTGTLDPMATGVLPVLIGRAVKASEYVMSGEKGYTAEMTLGVETDTEDITGTVLRTCENIPSADEVIDVCSRFTGEIMQVRPCIPPSGRTADACTRLPVRARGRARRRRAVTVSSIVPEQLDSRRWRLTVECSKGTYIRTLCADIGKALGCGAAMSALRRTRSGNFTLDGAHTIDELENLTYEQRCALLVPTERAFGELPAVELGDFFFRLASCGAEIYLKKIRVSLPVGTVVRLRHGGEFFALGRVESFPDGDAVKPIKQFGI